jgi:hypothetical protein
MVGGYFGAAPLQSRRYSSRQQDGAYYMGSTHFTKGGTYRKSGLVIGTASA